MKKIAIFIIVLILLILLMPCIVFAKETYTISINKGKAERDGKSRNWVTVDDFIYYSFYDTKASFVKDGDNYTLTLPANKYTSPNGDGSASGTISVPKITFKGKGSEQKYDQYVIELTGTVDGTITSHTKGDFEKNYKFNVTSLKLKISYSTKLVKNRKS